MSLIDPLESAKRREINLQGSGTALIASLIAAIAVMAFAGLFGFGIGAVVDQIRVMTINSVFGNWEAGVSATIAGWGMPVAIIGLIFSVSTYGKWNHRYTGNETYYAGLGPLTLILLGLTAGVTYAVTMWAPADQVGVALDPVFNDSQEWGVGEWIMYAAQWWLPGIFAILALLSLMGRMTAQAGRRRRTADVAGLMSSGRTVKAKVVTAPVPDLESARTTGSIVFKFADAQGQDRWVKFYAILPARQIPSVGSERPLVYDPMDPGNVKRIFVSPSGGTAASDFVRVRAAD